MHPSSSATSSSSLSTTTNNNHVIDLCDSPSETTAAAAGVAFCNSETRSKEEDGDDDVVLVLSSSFPNKKLKSTNEPPPTAAAQAQPSLVFLNSDPRDNCVVTPLVFPCLLDKATANVRLCNSSSSLLHIQQQDGWSCGFRNMQMILSALLPLLSSDHAYYKYHQDEQSNNNDGVVMVPSLTDIQKFMERSWAAGYDPKGARHFQFSMIGKRVWIGAVEVAACCSFLGLDATVVQFVHCAASRQALGGFLVAYFDDASPMSSLARVHECLQQRNNNSTAASTTAATTPCLPLYLQWKGHSVTVVGVECTNHGDPTHVWVLDPRKKGSLLLQNANSKAHRIPLAPLQSKDIQVIVMVPRSLSPTEQTARHVQVVTAAQEQVQQSLLRR